MNYTRMYAAVPRAHARWWIEDQVARGAIAPGDYHLTYLHEGYLNDSHDWALWAYPWYQPADRDQFDDVLQGVFGDDTRHTYYGAVVYTLDADRLELVGEIARMDEWQ